MKTLYLVRHAKSSWKHPELDDFERPLNKRGRESAPLMGIFLKKLKVAPNLLLSSPANRAAMTARIIADGIDYPLEEIQYNGELYLSGVEVLIHVIEHLKGSVKEAMLIGHNPEFTHLANYISGQRISNIPTCGVFCTELNISSWGEIGENCGKIKFFEYPKKISS